MDHRDEGHWPKIIRAEEHLAAIRAEIDFFREGEACGIVGKFEESGEYVITLKTVLSPSPRLAVLIGDCVGNMRNALDHLLYLMLGKWNPQAIAGDRTPQFPIRLSCITKKGRPISYESLSGLPEEVIALIKRNQPCCRGDQAAAHPLALIHNLSNHDKHRALFLTTIALTQGAIGVRLHVNGQLTPIRAAYIKGSFKAGAEIHRFPLTVAEVFAFGARRKEDVDVYGHMPASITFDEPEPPLDRPVLDVLDECLEFLRPFISEVAQAGGFI